MFASCSLFGFLLALTSGALASDPLVSTRSGVVRGREGSTEGLNRQYFAFQGIPYAEPPLGNQRFAPATPKSAWEGVLDATKDGPACIQGSDPVVGSEDCLLLNVYTPRLPDSSSVLLPTMVWIHGGGFEGGDATYENFGPDHLLDKQTVVVTIQYRLGILGFLSTGDLVVPGNNGLKDQLLALQWVRDNVERFGGDPNQVTIFGQSAGAASITYLIQSPLASGLFQRAIIQSGSCLATWAYSRHVPEVAATVVGTVGLDNSTSQSIVSSLRSLNATYLQQTAAQVATDHYLAGNLKDLVFAYGPVTEVQHSAALFTKQSYEGLKNGDFNKVPIVIGYNSLEGTFMGGSISLLLLLFDLNPARLVSPSLNIVDPNLKSTVGREIKSQYFGILPIYLAEYRAMQYLSDDMFNRPIREFVNLVRSHNVPVYFYRFSYEGNLWGHGNRTKAGVTHSEELGYIFRSKYEAEATADDILTRERLTSMWTNFAKTGHPTPDSREAVLKEVVWQRSDASYTHIDIGTQIVTKQNPEAAKMTFWDNVFAKYGTGPYSTY